MFVCFFVCFHALLFFFGFALQVSNTKLQSCQAPSPQIFLVNAPWWDLYAYSQARAFRLGQQLLFVGRTSELDVFDFQREQLTFLNRKV